MSSRRRVSFGVVGAALGLAFAVLALSPAEWAQRVRDWTAPVGQHPWVAIACISLLLLGGGLGFAIAMTRYDDDRKLVVLPGGQYEKVFQQRIKSGEFTLVKIFGYTGEVTNNNLFQYMDKYRNLSAEILVRNWIAEFADQDTHNRNKAGSHGLWDKADTIRALEDTSTNLLRKTFRYYDHQPCIKASILCSPHGKREAFLTFHHFVPNPPGGSQFKGADMPTLYLPGDTPEQSLFIEYLESQFRYEWEHALDKGGVRLAEGKALRMKKVSFKRTEPVVLPESWRTHQEPPHRDPA